jgi:hypothetical protein
VAALLFARNGRATVAGVKQRLLATTVPSSSLASRTVSGGIVNADRAVCDPDDLSLAVTPSEGFEWISGEPQVVRAAVHDCLDAVTGASVHATVGTGGSTLVLRDDGVAPDRLADDGVYSAHWTPPGPGPVEIAFSAVHAHGELRATSAGRVVKLPRYRMVEIGSDWIDATRGERLDLRHDEEVVEVPTGFPFAYFGQLHERLFVSSNGHLDFAEGRTRRENEPIPDPLAPNALVAPFWDDLDPSAGGAVYALLEGTAPHRRFTVQWDRVPYADVPNSAVTFQTTLYENTGRVVFRYRDVESSRSHHDYGASATVGIEGPHGSRGIQYSYDRPAVFDGVALAFSPDRAPALGVAGRKLVLKDRRGRPEDRKLKIVLADPRIAPGEPVGRAEIRIVNPTTRENATIPLAGPWRRHGAGAFSLGDRGCGLKMRSGRLSVSCRGRTVRFGLDEAAQGELIAIVELEEGASYCATFGGKVRADRSTSLDPRGRGRFEARRAPAGTDCGGF